MSDRNARVVEDFRANEGQVGGQFEGAPMLLLHHVGRNSGTDRVAPLLYQPGEDGVMYVFASYAGAATHPEWYYNLLSAGTATVEVGTESFAVTVRELQGAERDRLYAEQASRYPAFTQYEKMTAGKRVIPVLALRRTSLDAS